jgi:hypothetical protein
MTKLSEKTLEHLEKEVKRIQGKYNHRNYNPNHLWEAANYYNMSAEDWTEIIRLEEGANMALNDVIAYIKSHRNK